MANPLETSIVTLSNACALASAIMQQVSGNEVGESVGGTVAGRQTFDNFFISHMTRQLSEMRPTSEVN